MFVRAYAIDILGLIEQFIAFLSILMLITFFLSSKLNNVIQ